jgi:hypothetical protein
MLRLTAAAILSMAVASSAAGAPKKPHAAPAPAPAVAPAPAPPPPPWVVSPNERSCNANLQLTGPSGALTQIAFVSDGGHTILMFTKDEIAEKAFLPLMIDHKPYSNLVQRLPNAKFGAMTLSDEALAALRQGKTLEIDWLASEPITMPLGAADQGLTDLNICGKQVFGQFQAAQATAANQKAHADAAMRAKTESDARIAAAEAQKKAAEAERRRAIFSGLGGDSGSGAYGGIQTRTYVVGGRIVTCTTSIGVTNCN